MSDVIPLDELERKAAKQHAATVAALRTLADRIEHLAEWKLREALPIAAAQAAELEQRLTAWFRTTERGKR